MHYKTRFKLVLDKNGRNASWLGNKFSKAKLKKTTSALPVLASIYILRTSDGRPFYVGETHIGLRRNLQEFRFPESDFKSWRHHYASQEIFSDHYVFANVDMSERQFRRYIEAKFIDHLRTTFPDLRNKVKQLPRDRKFHLPDSFINDCINFAEK